MKSSVSFALAAAALLTGCGKKEQAAHGPPPPQPVVMAPVEERKLVEWGEFAGRVEAVESVDLRPRVSGYIDEVRLKAGQLVEKGDVLFVIDPRAYQAAKDRADGEVKRAEAAAVAAKKEAERIEPLLAVKAISPEQAEARRAAGLQAEAAVLAAKAGARAAALDQEFTEVRAPISGRVSRAMVTAGNYVSGNPGAATLLTTIVSVNPVYVYADMEEDTYLKVQSLAREKKLALDKEGRIPAEVKLSDEKEFGHKGWIESFDNRLNPGTGSMMLRVQLPNDAGALTPGLFARVRLPLSAEHPVLLVEEASLGTDQSRKFVMTVRQEGPVSVAEYRPVVLGPQYEGKRIIREGVKAGEKVIVSGQARVFMPGMPVVEEAAPPSPPPAKNTTAAASR